MRIFFEDTHLLVLEKPAGMVVNRVENQTRLTLQDWMDNYCHFVPHKNTSEFAQRSGIVHRLDKDTSGVMVLAKTQVAFVNLKKQFKQRLVKKEYLALVHGRVEPLEGTINLPLTRNALNRLRFRVGVDGRHAETHYTVLDVYKKFEDIINKKGSKEKNRLMQPNNRHFPKDFRVKHGAENNYRDKNVFLFFSLMRLFPHTGRTHQLRVHLSHIGYPIVSDPIYLGKRYRQDLSWCPRLFLHAMKLSFMHPVLGKQLEYSSVLAKDLEGSLKKLSKI